MILTSHLLQLCPGPWDPGTGRGGGGGGRGRYCASSEAGMREWVQMASLAVNCLVNREDAHEDTREVSQLKSRNCGSFFSEFKFLENAFSSTFSVDGMSL